MNSLYFGLIEMLLQESLWIMTFFWILKEMIRVFRWNVICYTWYFFQLFIFFFSPEQNFAEHYLGQVQNGSVFGNRHN